jgi:hypothetical protein
VTSGYWVKRLEDVPLVPTDDPDDFDWYPLQHHFGLTAFGVNVFGGDAGIELVHEHDETASGQEELYVVLRGAARVTVGSDSVDAGALTVVAVPEPAVRRGVVAIEDGTLLFAVGGNPGSFETTWRAQHFERVPTAE